MNKPTLNFAGISDKPETGFVVRKLSPAEENKIKENAAIERAEAIERMEARATAVERDDTMGEFDKALDDWLLVNEGRHLKGADKVEYRAAARAGGVLPAPDTLPNLGTTLETPETGNVEDN